MRLLTYNCCALPLLTGDIPRRLRLAARAIAALEPDVILLQEVFLLSHLETLRAELGGWPHAAFERLSFSRVAGGICLLSRRPPRAWGFSRFSCQGPVWRMSGIVRLNPKGFVWAELDGLHLIHTHLVADYRISLVDAAVNPYHGLQEAQLSQVEAHLARADGRAVVVAGDLNMKPDAPALRRFMERLRLQDAMPGVTAPSVIEEPYYRIPFFWAPNKRLDYVLFRGLEARGPGRYALQERSLAWKGRRITPSDHLGVVAELAGAASRPAAQR